MVNVAIYYRLDIDEDESHAIVSIESLIKELESENFIIKQIFIDAYLERDQLDRLLDFRLGELDILYLNTTLDCFDKNLLEGAAKANDFSINFFSD